MTKKEEGEKNKKKANEKIGGKVQKVGDVKEKRKGGSSEGKEREGEGNEIK